jgi:hypothetical protein
MPASHAGAAEAAAAEAPPWEDSDVIGVRKVGGTGATDISYLSVGPTPRALPAIGCTDDP